MWACVQDTTIDAVRGTGCSTFNQVRGALSLHLLCCSFTILVLPILHKQRLPALVVRCVEHLMKWGVEEEGLFW
jgi:hypothetical protein